MMFPARLVLWAFMPTTAHCKHCRQLAVPGQQYCQGCGAVIPWAVATEVHVLEDPPAFLLLHLPGGIVRKEELRGNEVRIGRSDRCDLIVDHPRISRHHATLIRRGAGYMLSDARSSGGTFLNDEPVHGEVSLASGDSIRLGRLPGESVVLVYHEGED